MVSSQREWDQRFMGLAEHVARWSKDPSTQCGAVVVNDKNRVMGVGFNGLPRGVHDTSQRLDNRSVKYQLVLHAEDNALAFATETEDCTLYVWPMAPCGKCMSRAIQHGITRIVYLNIGPNRWMASVQLGLTLATEAGIEVSFLGQG